MHGPAIIIRERNAGCCVPSPAQRWMIWHILGALILSGCLGTETKESGTATGSRMPGTVATGGATGSVNGGSAVNGGNPAQPQAPSILSFNVVPSTITEGQSATLTWNVTGATQVTVSPSNGVVGGAASLVVSPAKTQTYTLTISSAQGTRTATTTLAVTSRPMVGAFPILFVTQVPVSGFGSRLSAFANHLGKFAAAPRGGDLMIRYPDGSIRNLTQEAGLGSTGFQGSGAIAVREPAVHWSGTKAVFSMVVGAPASQFQNAEFYWQLYEVTGLGKNEPVSITKVANQPANYNNVSPIYGTDERILFTSDRPRSGERHLYPQLDEYESTATVTGIWSLQPSNGDLKLPNHAISGAFSPSIDSFGRLVFIRWDHLQQDQQADADRVKPTYGSFNFQDETANSIKLPLQNEVFPEPRLSSHPENLARQVNGHTFNLFMPWQMNEDGTEEETLNHVGRHEFTGLYSPPTFKNDPSLVESRSDAIFANRTYLQADGGLFHLREDPLRPGVYFGTHAREFGTDAGNQLVRFTGAPGVNPEAMVITPVTHPDTAGFTVDGAVPSASHTGMYRTPVPLHDGTVVTSHTVETRLNKNEGTRGRPTYRYEWRLKSLVADGPYWKAGPPITPGFRKTVWGWDPDVRFDFDGLLWELDPVEVVPRSKPVKPASPLEPPERQVFIEEAVDEIAFRNWLRTNDLALIVTRNNTSRDRGDKQQPFNLRVPGGVSRTGDGGKIYDIAHLQVFQADQVRGYGGPANPRPGRRPLARALNDPKAINPANPAGPVGSVKLGTDGSSAAFVPARRALTWQLTDGAGSPVVRERNWISFQPGEIRACASCHGVNSRDQAGGGTPTNKPEALRQLLRFWKSLPK
jgi:Hydrazine synthase alpha subunit middle domain